MQASYPATVTEVNGIAESARQVEPAGRDPGGHQMRAERGHHRTVVGAEARPRHPYPDAQLRRPLLGEQPQPRVGGDTTTDDQGLDAVLPARVQGLCGEHVADGGLETGGNVGDRHGLAGALAGLDPPRDRGLQPREREIEPVLELILRRRQSTRERDGGRVAITRDPVDHRPTRETQPEQPGDLVERLTGRVVDRRAQRRHPRGEIVDQQQRRMTARHEHRDG
nr:hypothetical protein GCM10020092_098820 [Actinoplanes digitatis]